MRDELIERILGTLQAYEKPADGREDDEKVIYSYDFEQLADEIVEVFELSEKW